MASCDLDTAQKVTVYPSTGEHIFSAWPKGICGGGMSEQSGKVTGEKTLMSGLGTGRTVTSAFIQRHFNHQR
jgi:hypothetical protein